MLVFGRLGRYGERENATFHALGCIFSTFTCVANESSRPISSLSVRSFDCESRDVDGRLSPPRRVVVVMKFINKKKRQ